MSLAKRAAQALAAMMALPLLARHRLTCAVAGESRAFMGFSERLARRPGMMGNYVRQACYRRLLGGVGDDVHFGFMSVFSKTQAVVGHRVYIGRFCSLGWVELGDDVMLADGVQVLSGGRQHGTSADADQTLRDNPQTFTKVTIGQGAWIGAGAIIMADVGQGAIVAAGAVVTRPVADNAKVGGIPARPLPSPPSARADT